jgi:xylulokinase
MYGERTPIDDPTVRGGFFNLSLKITREHLVRAVFEGVAYNARWLLQGVEQFCRRRIDRLNMIGGGAKSDIWCQIYADVLGRTIRQVKEPLQANARGAALVGAVALGAITFDDVARHVNIAKEFVPNTGNRHVYDELFAEFVNIYHRNKSIYARLNRAR